MSWGYWGILAGVVALLAILFVCMELLYAGARGPAKENGSGADESREGSERSESKAKHAA